MRTILRPLPTLAAVAALIHASVAHAEPPRIVRAIPDNADLIDPAIREMRFEFDQPMSPRGHSICGGGPTFPSIQGDIRWETDRILVVPVRLEPERIFQFSLNCPNATGLRSADGQTLAPYPIQFRTLPAEAPAPTLEPGAAEAVLEALRTAIDDRYSYRDLRGVDWDRTLEDAAPSAAAAQTPAELARAVARTLAAAQDIHISVEVNGLTLGTHQRDAAPNVDVRLLGRIVPEVRQATRRVVLGEWEDGVHYILIGGWDSAAQPEDLPAILEAVDAASGAPGLVIDVRMNSGGNEEFARRVASRLAKREAVYARSLIRDPSEPDGFAGPFDRSVSPDTARPDGFEPPDRIAVLIGPVCMSSNESFIQMMAHACDARLFGERTYGSSGNPRPHDLGSGITVVLPSWQDVDPHGVIREGIGIEPDETIPWRAQGESDPVLDAALRWIRSGV